MEEPAEDAMIVLAALVSRTEALVTASMLEAAGIMVHVGGAGHASVEVNSLVLGGHRLWIPASQHAEASVVLLEVLGDDEWSFSYGLRRAVLRMMAVSVGVFALVLAGSSLAMVGRLIPETFWASFAMVIFPANPQGRGDYFLRAADGRTYWA